MILPPNSVHRRGDLNDQQWQRLKPLMPAQKPSVGRPSNDHRTIINGILWIVRTGAPWRDLPERYGAWETVSGRFYSWRKRGLWGRILQKVQQQAQARGQIDWEMHHVDGVSSVPINMQPGQGGENSIPPVLCPRLNRCNKEKPWEGLKEDSALKSICGVTATAYPSPSC